MNKSLFHIWNVEPSLPEDPVLLDAMIKGGTGEKRNTGAILTVCLLTLAILAAGAIYIMRLPEPVDFFKADNIMFNSLWQKYHGKELCVERVDGYYQNGWYWFDVSFSAGQDETARRLIYFGRGEVQDYIDPEKEVMTTDELALLSSFQTAQASAAEHKHYTPQECARECANGAVIMA